MKSKDSDDIDGKVPIDDKKGEQLTLTILELEKAMECCKTMDCDNCPFWREHWYKEKCFMGWASDELEGF